jgi:AcrR family transcriptional regulator
LIDVQFFSQGLGNRMGRRADHTAEELRRLALDAARAIVSEQGLRSLTTRGIAKVIGYTSGTLYQIFENFDDLVQEMNAETIDQLRIRCERVDMSEGPSRSLSRLAEEYVDFTSRHAMLWNALFELKLPLGHPRNEKYQTSVRLMLGVVERAIAPLFQPGEERARLHDVRLLWAWLYGISALGSGGRLHEEESVAGMTQTVIDIYVGARLRAKAASAAPPRSAKRSRATSAKRS